MADKVICFSCDAHELDALTKVWKMNSDCTNRTQYIKLAINKYAKEEVFKT